MGRLSEVLARGAHAVGVVVARAAPSRLRKAVEDRVFYVIFQKTRVENDAYGWRPPPPGPAAPSRTTTLNRTQASAGDP